MDCINVSENVIKRNLMEHFQLWQTKLAKQGLLENRVQFRIFN